MILTIIEIIFFMLLAAVLGGYLVWHLKDQIRSEDAQVKALKAEVEALKQNSGSVNLSAGENSGSSANFTEEQVRAETEPRAGINIEHLKNKAITEIAETGSTIAAQFEPDAATTADTLEQEGAQFQAVQEHLTQMEATDESDDLTEIFGIGPKFAERLNEMGIVNYRQIASLDEKHIESLINGIGAIKGRALSDDWVSGAKTAYFEKYGKQLLD